MAIIKTFSNWRALLDQLGQVVDVIGKQIEERKPVLAAFWKVRKNGEKGSNCVDSTLADKTVIVLGFDLVVSGTKFDLGHRSSESSKTSGHANICVMQGRIQKCSWAGGQSYI